PTPPAAKAMRPVVELRTRILHIRALAAGETLGDQLHFTAKRATKVALISVGRADGFPSPVAANDRKLQVIIGGHRCPVIGRPSSDLAAVDITSLPDPSAARRDKPVTLIGDGIGIEEIAAATQQAGREVLACLGARFHRVYHVN
ncbi:MAG TPA: alanine racemase C-terminal domain-containing protein, partial [Xanthobacteraceae bacterium]|nr:alanine racemase C-terminal domain-containing protein [Xanthobacteraceae bacterium]